jgi:hypothetical protein
MQTDEQQIKKVFFNTDNPNSLVNRVWVSLVPYLQAVADVYPHHIMSNENKVKAFCNPDEKDLRVRLRFWDEYYLATAQDREMTLQGVINGVITSETWNHTYLTDRRRLLWLITQPVSYTSNMRSLLEKGLEKLHEIMDMPLVSKNGTPDVKLITQVLKAFQLIDLRVKGSVVQRMQIDQRSLNVNVDGGEVSPTAGYNTLSLEQLKELEKQLDRIAEKRENVIGLLPEESRPTDFVDCAVIPDKVMITTSHKADSRVEQVDEREDLTTGAASAPGFREYMDLIEGEGEGDYVDRTEKAAKSSR